MLSIPVIAKPIKTEFHEEISSLITNSEYFKSMNIDKLVFMDKEKQLSPKIDITFLSFKNTYVCVHHSTFYDMDTEERSLVIFVL